MTITTAMAASFKQELMRGQHCLTSSGFTVTGSSSSSVNYTSVSSLTNISLGMSFTGTNVGASSKVTDIVSSSAFTSSVAASGSISGGTLTFTNPMSGSYKLALYTSSASLDSTTTTYSATNEASGTNYSAGGSALTLSASNPQSSGGVAFTDFADLVFSTVTITARGCEIYNSYGGLNRTVSVHDFGADKTATAGDFTIIFPTADSSNAILRLS
jgi:hypothetical protein